MNTTHDSTDRAPQNPGRGAKMDINDYRIRIDEIDERLLSLLNERAQCALEIGHIKRALGLPVYVPEREHQVLDHVQNTNPGPLRDGAIRRLFERIIDESRRLEQERVAEDRRREQEQQGQGSGSNDAPREDTT